MTKTVKNRASPTRTEVGGTCWVPTAVRSRAKTMMILKKLVTEIKKKGTSEISEMPKISWILEENCGEPMMELRSRAPVMGALCAQAVVLKRPKKAKLKKALKAVFLPVD
jgi:hypothetical protein